jgi:hypothetical protein
VILRAGLAFSVVSGGASVAASDGPQTPHAGNNGQAEHTITVRIEHATLRDAIAAFEQASSLSLHPLWADDQHADGLDPERDISLDCRARPAMAALESLLRRADETATWQLDAEGAIEVGPRSRLNEHRAVRLYPVRDLLTAAPDYREMPAIDLQAALQQGGSTPLREEPAARASDPGAAPDPARDLIALITSTIEPDQWSDVGGVATIRRYQDTLVITAPGYIHRQIGGESPALPGPR